MLAIHIEELEIPTDGDTMAAVLARPDRPASSGVLVLMEAFGVNDHIRDVCGRFAALGYVALAPDLYHRRGRFLTGDYDDPSGVMGHFASLDADEIATDISVASERLTDEVDTFGVIGFCLGGYGAVLAAIRSSPAIVASFYGAGLSIQRQGSPLAPLAAEFGSIECPVHLFYGANDPVIPSTEIEATERALAHDGVEHSVHTYDEAGHGFFCDAREAYRADPAADAWRHVTATFALALPAAGS